MDKYASKRMKKKDKLPGLVARPGSKLHAKKYQSDLIRVTRTDSAEVIKYAIEKAFPFKRNAIYFGKTRSAKYEGGHLEIVFDFYKLVTIESGYSPMIIPYLVYLDPTAEKKFIDQCLGRTKTRTVITTIGCHILCDPQVGAKVAARRQTTLEFL